MSKGLKRGWIRVAGLMSTFASIHCNLRMHRKWASATRLTGDDILLQAGPEILGYGTSIAPPPGGGRAAAP